MAQDVIADEALLSQPFSKEGQSDWLRSLRRVARAQAILWARTDINIRKAILAEVEAEAEAFEGAKK